MNRMFSSRYLPFLLVLFPETLGTLYIRQVEGDAVTSHSSVVGRIKKYVKFGTLSHLRAEDEILLLEHQYPCSESFTSPPKLDTGSKWFLLTSDFRCNISSIIAKAESMDYYGILIYPFDEKTVNSWPEIGYRPKPNQELPLFFISQDDGLILRKFTYPFFASNKKFFLRLSGSNFRQENKAKPKTDGDTAKQKTENTAKILNWKEHLLKDIYVNEGLQVILLVLFTAACFLIPTILICSYPHLLFYSIFAIPVGIVLYGLYCEPVLTLCSLCFVVFVLYLSSTSYNAVTYTNRGYVDAEWLERRRTRAENPWSQFVHEEFPEIIEEGLHNSDYITQRVIAVMILRIRRSTMLTPLSIPETVVEVIREQDKDYTCPVCRDKEIQIRYPCEHGNCEDCYLGVMTARRDDYLNDPSYTSLDPGCPLCRGNIGQFATRIVLID